MDCLNILDVFYEEEKIILNHLAVDSSKDLCCDQLSMGMAICSDDDVFNVLQSTLSKILNLSVDEWSCLQSFLPCEVSVSDSDFDLTDTENIFDN